MHKEKYSFLSADMETKLNTVIWKPEEKADAILIVAHGIGEHVERYEELAKYFTERKMIVAGYDCIGHGKSTSTSKAPMYFGKEGSWEYLVKDLITFNNIMIEKFDNLPIFILGFSMGSFVVRTALAQKRLTAKGIILAGTGSVSPLVVKLVKILVKQEAMKNGGDDKISGKVNNLAFGNYNKYFKPCRTEFDWLCKNEKAIDEYMEDELSRKFITPGMFKELLSGIAYTSKPSVIRNSENNIPLLFLSGSDDPVGNFEKGTKKVVKGFEKNGTKVTAKFYKDCRHDIFHDNYKNTVIRDIYNWISSITQN